MAVRWGRRVPLLLPGVHRPACSNATLSPPCPPSTAPQVLDTCADSDCGGCCTANARRSGGTLLDLEFNTAKRFWGEGGVQDLASIDWQVV